VVLRIATAGDVLGVRSLLLGKTHDLLAETIEETRLCFIPRNKFLDFLKRHGEVSLQLAQRLSTEVDEAYQQVCSVRS
jgi:CRP/FNR family transcriptional regulator